MPMLTIDFKPMSQVGLIDKLHQIYHNTWVISMLYFDRYFSYELYTFYSWISGAGFGLSLTLNIEQYEYISGPNTDAGVKVRMEAWYILLLKISEWYQCLLKFD